MRSSRLRLATFSIGCLALGVSVVILIASFLQTATPADYVQQAREAGLWVRWGMATSLMALLLCCAGTGGFRVAVMLVAFVLLSFWFFIGVSLV